MKAIILAAGKGERLKEITKKTPKPMLKVKGEIILEHNLKWLKRYGIREIFINLHHLPNLIRSYFKDGSKWGIEITYSYEKRILGTAGGVRKILSDCTKQKWYDDFLVVYGDNFYPLSYDLERFINSHFRNEGIATIGLYRKKTEICKSGVAILNKDNLIVDFVEKPKLINSKSKNQELRSDIIRRGLINTGLYAMNHKVLDYIPEGFSDFGRDVFPDLLKKRIPIYGYVFRDQLIAVDTVRLYEKH